MSSTYTLTPTNRATGITIPSDGDTPIKAADVNPALQAAADLAANAIERLEPLTNITALKAILVPTNNMVRSVIGYGLYTFLTAATYGQEPYFCAATDATPGRWVSTNAYSRVSSASGTGPSAPTFYRAANPGRPLPGASTEVVTVTNNPNLSVVIPSAAVQAGLGYLRFLTVVTGSGAVGTHVVYDLTDALIDKCTLLSVDVTITPQAGHVAVPQLMPTGFIVRTHALTGAKTELRAAGAFADSSLLAAYAVLHEIGGVCDQNNVIDLSLYSYSLVFTNEGGTNSIGGLYINGIRCWMGDS